MPESDPYLVWSNEHGGWWGPGGFGYAPDLRSAGRFTRAQALKICRDALPTAAHIGMISEIPVRLADMSKMLEQQIIPACVMGSK